MIVALLAALAVPNASITPGAIGSSDSVIVCAYGYASSLNNIFKRLRGHAPFTVRDIDSFFRGQRDRVDQLAVLDASRSHLETFEMQLTHRSDLRLLGEGVNDIRRLARPP